MGIHKPGFVVSILLCILTVFLLNTKGMNLGIDFTGGIVMEMRTQEPADMAQFRALLEHADLGEISLQQFGGAHDVMLRVQASADADQAKIVQHIHGLLDTAIPNIEYRKVDYVGPQVGAELIRSGIMAVILSFVAIMVYVWFRFEWQYGVGAIAALVHDAFLTVGFIIVTGIEFNLTSIAAILTIVGYSINDSVVIYDRVRENLRRYKKMDLSELLNRSLNETLSRTILTVATAILAVLALVFAGGEVIRSFSLIMLFGIVIGTYSSIYISVPVLLYTRLRAREEEPTAPAQQAK